MKRLRKIVIGVGVVLAVAFVMQVVAFLCLTGQGPFSGGSWFFDESRVEMARRCLFAVAGVAALAVSSGVVLRRVRRLRSSQEATSAMDH